MLVSSIDLRSKGSIPAFYSDDELAEIQSHEFDGYDSDANELHLPENNDKIIKTYVLTDNYTGEEFIFLGYCPDIYNSEQNCMLPAQITVYAYEFVPKGYKGGFNRETSISTKSREDLVDWLMNLWTNHIGLDKEDLRYCADRILFANKPEVSPLRRKIAESERFYISKETVADFTYNYSRILSEGGNGEALEMFSNIYLCLNRFDLDTYEFSDGFSEMVYRGASHEELEIYSEAALKLLFIGELLVDENDRFGGLNNACISYVMHTRRKSEEELKSICNHVIEMADKRHELLEIEREQLLNDDIFAYETNWNFGDN